jgi:hypothetical protein
MYPDMARHVGRASDVCQFRDRSQQLCLALEEDLAVGDGLRKSARPRQPKKRS